MLQNYDFLYLTIRYFFVSLQFIYCKHMKKFFRFILLIVNLVFAVAMLLSTLSGTLTPSHFAWISILSYGYFILLLSNVLFVIIWLCMGRWEFLVSVVAIVLRFSFVGLFFQVGGCRGVEAADDNMKVLSFNTHGFNGLDSDTLMTADSGAMLFLHILDEEQPDVLCLQEFFPPSRFGIVDSFEVRGYKYFYGCKGNTSYSPAIIFSRCPIVGVHNMDERSKFNIDIEKNGKIIKMCCVHLDSYNLDEEDREGLERLSRVQMDSSTHRMFGKLAETTRQHESEWKEELLPMVEKSRTPVIIAGDFNDTPASYIYHQAKKLLVDSYVEQGIGFGTTYHGPYPAYRIDYILHSPQLEALSYKRIKTNISDHYPIVVQVKI